MVNWVGGGAANAMCVWGCGRRRDLLAAVRRAYYAVYKTLNDQLSYRFFALRRTTRPLGRRCGFENPPFGSSSPLCIFVLHNW